MSLLAIDVGGTKIAGALFSQQGQLIKKVTNSVSGLEGDEIGQIIGHQISELIDTAELKSDSAKAVGVSVPGIYNPDQETVWAPNLPGWESYPLKKKITDRGIEQIPVAIDSDRSCYILGEVWMGNAQNCKDAIFLAVGTGIGAGILVNGQVLRGSNNIAGAVGWMGLSRPYQEEYQRYGCFEYHSSGEGLVRVARKYLENESSYRGKLAKNQKNELDTNGIFEAYANGDLIAKRVIDEAVGYWGMATANLVSIFNPQKILFGGGVFESAAPLLDQIRDEARRWAQPIAIDDVSIELAGLGSEAGIFGAAYLALTSLDSN